MGLSLCKKYLVLLTRSSKDCWLDYTVIMLQTLSSIYISQEINGRIYRANLSLSTRGSTDSNKSFYGSMLTFIYHAAPTEIKSNLI